MIKGTTPSPAPMDTSFDRWEIDNYIVLGWLFNSMETRIYHMGTYYVVASSFWTALNEIYE